MTTSLSRRILLHGVIYLKAFDGSRRSPFFIDNVNSVIESLHHLTVGSVAYFSEV